MTLTEITCSECGITFGLPQFYMESRRKDHNTFWCPNGHGQVFKAETDADRYKRMYQEATVRQSEIAHKLEVAKRAEEKASKALHSLQHRTAAGVCPCCTRTVSQLAEHMKSKHPEYRELAGLNPVKLLPEKVQSNGGGGEDSIEYLDMSVRSYNGLKNAGILTVPQLTGLTEAQLFKVKNLGTKSVKELREALQARGLTLKAEGGLP